MAELVTIARPYAAAAFSYAKAKDQLAQWSDMLALLVSIYQDEQMQEVLHNPQLTKDDIQRTLLAVCADQIDDAARNLLVLLVENNRLNVLPAIRDLFEELKANYENEVDAQIESAFPLSEDQVRVLVQQARSPHRAQGEGERERGPGADRRGARAGRRRTVGCLRAWPARYHGQRSEPIG